VWEPRYFLPVLPAVAVLGAAALHWFAFDFIGGRMKHAKGNPSDPLKKRLTSMVVTIIILMIIALPGIVPAANNFSDLEEGQVRHPPARPAAVRVTTDQLVQNPQKFEDRFVLVPDAEVTRLIRDGCEIRSIGAREPENVTVLFRNWPPDRMPKINSGDRVEVWGLFSRMRNPDAPFEYFISVKYDTEDYIRIL
jgi:hypothetical protein